MNKPRSVAAKKTGAAERERVSLVLPVALKAALIKAAAAELRTLNAQCELLLTQGLRDRGVQI